MNFLKRLLGRSRPATSELGKPAEPVQDADLPIRPGALHNAVRIGDLDTVRALLKRGVNVDESMNGVTPLHVAAGLGSYSPGRKGVAPPRSTEVAELLVEHGADVTARGANLGIGRTPLHGFAENGNTEMVALLIERGAEVNARDVDGRTPLHIAARWGYPEVAKLLIEAGADVNARVMDGSKPLRLATMNDHEEVAELLRQHGGVR